MRPAPFVLENDNRLVAFGQRSTQIERIPIRRELVEHMARRVADAWIGKALAVPTAGHAGSLLGIVQGSDEQLFDGAAYFLGIVAHRFFARLDEASADCRKGG